MRVLYLTNNWDVARPLYEWLSERVQVTPRTDQFWICERVPKADLIVSYCYRYIIPGWVLSQFQGAVNLHNALLPFGRGVEPLLFGVLDGEHTGVSRHWMTEVVDGGEVIAQMPTPLSDDLTFRDAYFVQHSFLTELFKDNWIAIQSAVGSYHSMEDARTAMAALGSDGWDCTLGEAKRRWRA
jgi:methionyl-tRNA formyltransferase